MADAIVQVAPDSTGAKIDNESLTVGANTVMRQRTMIAGSGAAELARILAATPAVGDYGLVVRPQQNSRKVSGTLGALNDAVTIACDGVGDIFVDVDSGTLNAIMQIEATTDDTNWFLINYMDSGGGIYSQSGAPFRGYMQTNAYSQVRARVSSYTSGTANARLVGKMGGAGIVRLAHSLAGGTADANTLTNAIVSGIYGYNGATWDRLRSTIANGLKVDVTRAPSDDMAATFRGRTQAFRTPGRAGTTGQKIFALHNATGSTKVVRINQITIDLVMTVIKAITVLPPMIRLHRFTALPTGGTALSKTAKDTALTSDAAITVWGDASADGTSSGTALAVTIPAGSMLTQEFAPRFITGAGYEPFDRATFLDGGVNVVLRALEGIVVNLDYVLATQNPTTDMWLVGCDWYEI